MSLAQQKYYQSRKKGGRAIAPVFLDEFLRYWTVARIDAIVGEKLKSGEIRSQKEFPEEVALKDGFLDKSQLPPIALIRQQLHVRNWYEILERYDCTHLYRGRIPDETKRRKEICQIQEEFRKFSKELNMAETGLTEEQMKKYLGVSADTITRLTGKIFSEWKRGLGYQVPQYSTKSEWNQETILQVLIQLADRFGGELPNQSDFYKMTSLTVEQRGGLQLPSLIQLYQHFGTNKVHEIYKQSNLLSTFKIHKTSRSKNDLKVTPYQQEAMMEEKALANGPEMTQEVTTPESTPEHIPEDSSISTSDHPRVVCSKKHEYTVEFPKAMPPEKIPVVRFSTILRQCKIQNRKKIIHNIIVMMVLTYYRVTKLTQFVVTKEEYDRLQQHIDILLSAPNIILLEEDILKTVVWIHSVVSERTKVFQEKIQSIRERIDALDTQLEQYHW